MNLHSSSTTDFDADEACIPLIVSGAPRSGTSLLYNLFDGHGRISWLIDEGFLFEYLYDAQALVQAGHKIMIDSAHRDIDGFVLGIRDKQVMPPVEVGYHEPGTGAVTEIKIDAPWSEKAFRAALASAEFDDVPGMWQALARACLAGLGQKPRRYCCMKAPDYGRSAIAALENIPGSKAILVSRDPVFSLDSLKRTREMRGEKLLTWPSFAQCLAEMNAMVERVRDVDPARLMSIRYEDLIGQPKSVMQAVADWLVLDFDDCLLEPTVLGQTWPGASSFALMNGIDASGAAREVQALDAREIELIDTHLTPYRTQFGYSIAD